jgi:hypothetical protein
VSIYIVLFFYVVLKQLGGIGGLALSLAQLTSFINAEYVIGIVLNLLNQKLLFFTRIFVLQEVKFSRLPSIG